MRATALMILGLAALNGCLTEPDPPTLPADVPSGGNIAGSGKGDTNNPGSTTNPTKPNTTDTTTAKPTLEVLQEEVYVLMKDFKGGDWLCTGTLVSKDRVVTAGHCLDSNEFESYLVVAPLAPGKPRVVAHNPTPMNEDYNAVENPDIGFLTLETPIELPQYGILTDVTQQVDNGNVTATAVVRTAEELEAPFHAVDDLKVKSTTDDGYEHGFGVGLFSHGGDSGAGVFLVENGHATHKLIGVCRQPDPDTNTDELTRVDSDFLAWFKDNAGE